MFVTGTIGVGWDEYVQIRLADGSSRHGVVVDVDGDMTIALSEIILGGIPIVREFQYGILTFVTVPDESQREASVRIVLTAQQLHAENFGVKGNRSIEVTDPDHGVEHAHASVLLWHRV